MRDIRLVWLAGFMASAVYLICTIVAYSMYPLSYSPFANWLSDLGNPIANPGGALSYNLGCILASLGLTVFCLGLQVWDDGNKKRRILLTIAQVTGIISAFSLIVSAFFPLGTHTLTHEISGKLHIFFTGFFLSCSATILLRRYQTPKWLAYFGFLSAVVNFLYGAFLYSIFIAEWAAIGMFIVYILMISGTSLKHGAPHVVAGYG